MRLLTTTILASLMIPSLVACGAKGFKASDGVVQAASFASNAAPVDNSGGSKNGTPVNNLPNNNNSTGNVSVTLPTLKLSDAESMASWVNQLMAEINLRLQGISGGSFSFTSNSVSTNLTFNCSLGGTVKLISSAGSSASFTLTSVNVALSNGSGRLVFAGCKINQATGQPLQLDGTININSFSGSMRAALGLTTGIHSINASSNADLTGALVLTTGEVVKNCDIDIDRHSEINSTIDIFNGFKAAGSISASSTIKVCDFDFARNFSLSY